MPNENPANPQPQGQPQSAAPQPSAVPQTGAAPIQTGAPAALTLAQLAARQLQQSQPAGTVTPVQQAQPVASQPAAVQVQSAPVSQVTPVAQQTAAPQAASMTQPQPTVVAAPAPVQPAPAATQQSQTVKNTAPAQTPVQAPAQAAVQAQASAPALAQAPAIKTVPGQQPLKPGLPTRKPPNPKKLIFGCIGCSGALVLFFIIFVLIFVAQTTATGENPLAKSLNVDTGSFINTLILLVNLVFGSISVLLFVLAIVGLFRLLMARKDDKEAKKKGLTLAGVSGLLLVMFIFIWVGIYIFLSSKRVSVPKANQNSGFVTEPATTVGLTAPVTIKFDAANLPINTKKYQILSYLWSFGDGESSTVAVTTHTYKDMGANNGRYEVTLDVTKKDKQSNVESTDRYGTIVTIANVQINAEFSATPQNGPAPLTVDFDASASTAPAGDITSYEWDFDNNNIFTDASGANVSNTFDQVGTYKVNLRVTDNTGQFKIATREITVSGSTLPTAVINIPTKDGKYFTNVQYVFEADKSSSPTGKIVKYSWDFGDSSSRANTRTANHIYKTAGTFEVGLTVIDDSGASGQSTQKIKLEAAPTAPIAAITTVPAPKEQEDFLSGPVPFQVAFDAGKTQDSDDNIVDYKWDFDGDGQIDTTGKNVNYVYKTEGIYNTTLTVIDADNNQSNAVIVVKANAQPLQAQLKATPVEGVVPLTVTFDASGSSYPDGQIVSYEWDFGDGSPKRIDVSKLTYKYTKIGTFTAKVTAIASDNSKSTAQTPVNVRPVSLTACFAATPEQGAAPLAVEFDPKCSTGTISKYSWDFGDSQTSKTRKPSHTYTSPGSYQVTLEVSDNQNVINTYVKNILVTGTID